jgi:hypothetical protein
MEAHLRLAFDEVERAQPLVPPRVATVFASEISPIRWFYHTARTEANFYESCQIRDRLLALAGQTSRTASDMTEAEKLLRRWRDVLQDEESNTRQARPVMAADMRLDFYYGGDHTFSHGTDMLDAKLNIIGTELKEFLPKTAIRLGIANAFKASGDSQTP